MFIIGVKNLKLSIYNIGIPCKVFIMLVLASKLCNIMLTIVQNILKVCRKFTTWFKNGVSMAEAPQYCIL